MAMTSKATFGTGLRHLARCRRGNVMIEFAFMLPVFLLIALSAVELGRLSVEWMRVTRAANAGTLRAVQNSITQSGDANIIEAVREDANDTVAQELDIDVDDFYECPETPGVEVAAEFSCAGGLFPAQYRTVRVSQDLTAIFPYLDLPPSYALEVTSITRIR